MTADFWVGFGLGFGIGILATIGLIVLAISLAARRAREA